jgi:hypothetical protein
VTRFSSTLSPLRSSAERVGGWEKGSARARACIIRECCEQASERVFRPFVRLECDDEHTPDVLTRSN